MVLLFISFLILPSKADCIQIKNQSAQDFKKDSLGTGIVKFNTKADTIFLYLDKNFDELIKLTHEKNVTVSSGYRHLFVFGKNFQEKAYYLEVETDSTLTIQLPKVQENLRSDNSKIAAYAKLKWGANLIVETDHETSISLDGKPIGNGFAKLNLATGTYSLQFEHANGKKETKLVTVQKHRLKYFSHFFLPSKTKTKALSFFPGASQLQKDQYVKAGVAFTLTGIAVGLGVLNNSKFNNKKREFDQLRSLYSAATDEQQALEYGNQMDNVATTVDKFEQKRNLFLIAAGVLYALNIYDALQPPRSGYRRTNTLDPFKSFGIDLSNRNLALSVRIKF
ncbi:MAG: DUF5683 domain-containing protein [Pseudomonadota bacterium]|nr:DUF5683 domain-containing protein [Pseudomonadota bacterium]